MSVLAAGTSGTSNSSLDSIPETHGKKSRSRAPGEEPASSRHLSVLKGKESGLSSSSEIQSIDNVIEEKPETCLSSDEAVNNSEGAPKENGGIEVKDENASPGMVKSESDEIIGGKTDGEMNGEVDDHMVDMMGADSTIEENSKLGEITHAEYAVESTTDKLEVNKEDVACIDDVEIDMRNREDQGNLLENFNTNLDVCNGIDDKSNVQFIENQRSSEEAVKEQDNGVNGYEFITPSNRNIDEAGHPMENGSFSPSDELDEKSNEKDVQGTTDANESTAMEEKSNDATGAQDSNSLKKNGGKSRTTSERVKQRLQSKRSESDKGKNDSDEIIIHEEEKSGATSQNGKKRSNGERKNPNSTKRHESNCGCYPNHLRQKRTDNCSIM